MLPIFARLTHQLDKAEQEILDRTRRVLPLFRQDFDAFVAAMTDCSAAPER